MPQIRILLYHRVCILEDDFDLLSVKPELFRQQMAYLKKNYHILKLSDDFRAYLRSEEKDAVIITFDDCYFDTYSNALPILEEYNIPATFFVTTGMLELKEELWYDNLMKAVLTGDYYPDVFTLKDPVLGFSCSTQTLEDRCKLYSYLRKFFLQGNLEDRNCWMQQIFKWAGMDNVVRENRRLLSREELLALSQSNLATIGCHTIHHPSLAHLSSAEQLSEIQGATQQIEEITGKKVTLFSYPFGTSTDYNCETIEILKLLGYEKSVIAAPGVVDEQTDSYLLPRFTIRNTPVDAFGFLIKNKIFGDFESKQTILPDTGRVRFVGRLVDDELLHTSRQSIILWGAGKKGRYVLKEFLKYRAHERIIGFYDNDSKKWGTTLEGYKIMDYQANKEKQKDAIVCIVCDYEREVAEKLLTLGFKDIHIII